MKVGQIEDVRVKLEVVLGSAEYTVAEISGLGAGSIIELDSIAGEPVELRAGGERIGLGEVVVIDESFGIRVTEIDEQTDQEDS